MHEQLVTLQREMKTWNHIILPPCDISGSTIILWSDMMWCDMRPSMVTHTQNLCSAFNPSKVHTHGSEHIHTVNTHPEQWATIYAAAHGEQLGVRCLARGHLSRGIKLSPATKEATRIHFVCKKKTKQFDFIKQFGLFCVSLWWENHKQKVFS